MLLYFDEDVVFPPTLLSGVVDVFDSWYAF